jgi:hypothetical protein
MAGSKKGRNFYKPDSGMSSASEIVIARPANAPQPFRIAGPGRLP